MFSKIRNNLMKRKVSKIADKIVARSCGFDNLYWVYRTGYSEEYGKFQYVAFYDSYELVGVLTFTGNFYSLSTEYTVFYIDATGIPYAIFRNREG